MKSLLRLDCFALVEQLEGSAHVNYRRALHGAAAGNVEGLDASLSHKQQKSCQA